MPWGREDGALLGEPLACQGLLLIYCCNPKDGKCPGSRILREGLVLLNIPSLRRLGQA